jgi:hypothetical protein
LFFCRCQAIDVPTIPAPITMTLYRIPAPLHDRYIKYYVFFNMRKISLTPDFSLIGKLVKVA